MARSRTQKAALNTALSAVAEVVSLICGLILPRLILRNFGSAYNGITSSAKQFLSAVSILTVGIAGTTRVALYKSLAAKDLEKTSGIIWATEKYMRKVGYALLTLMTVLTIFYPLVVDTGYSWIEVAPLIVAAGISASGRYFFGTAYNALISADQSIYIFKIFLIVTDILNVVMSVLLIQLGCNVQIVKLASSVILLMNPVLRAVYVRRKYKLDRSVKPDRSALSMRWDVMAHSIANIVHDHTDIIVLTVFCNVKIVSVYTVYNLVMKMLKKTQAVFTGGTEAVYGDMWVKGELDKIRRNLGYYEYIMAVFSSVFFSATLVLILPFVSLYTKGVHDVEYVLPAYAAVITIAQVFFCLRTPYLTLVQGVGHYKQTKNGAYAEAIINLAVSILLVQFIGIVGVAVGTLLANIFRTVQYALYIDNHVIKRGKHVFAQNILWLTANIAIVYFVATLLTRNYADASWTAWVICGIVTVLIGCVVTLVSSLVFYRKKLDGVIVIVKRAAGNRFRRKTASK